MPEPDLTQRRNSGADLETAGEVEDALKKEFRARALNAWGLNRVGKLVEAVRWWIAFAVNAAKSAQDQGREVVRLRGEVLRLRRLLQDHGHDPDPRTP